MKKFLCMAVSAITLIGISCKGFEVQPNFVTIFGTDEKTFKLESFEQQPDNSVKLVFSAPVELTEVTVYNAVPEQLVCNTTKENIDGVEFYVIRCAGNIPIGEPYTVSGKVKSGKTTQDFSLKFIGKNSNPAQLAFVEYKPVHSTAKNSDPEFIKLKVIKSGNISGFTIRAVGSKKVPDYVFPACEVNEGEIIFVHLRAGAEKNADQNFADETGESIARDIKTARDFYARNFDKPSKREANIVVLDEDNEHVQDFLVCVHAKGFADGEFQWNDEATALIKKLQQAGFEDALNVQLRGVKAENVSGTFSLVKIGGIWKKQKYVSRYNR